jgi:hypothetical protein
LVNKNIPSKRWFKLAVACLATVTRLIRFAASCRKSWRTKLARRRISDRWILFPRGSKPLGPRLPPPRAAESKRGTTLHAGHGFERFAPSRCQVTNGQLYWGRVEPRGKTPRANRLPHFPIGRVHPIDKDPRYINELEQLLVDKIVPFFQDLVSGPTCVLELK